MSKFAKAGSITKEGPKPARGGLVVDIDNAKLAVRGEKSAKISEQKLAGEEKSAKGKKPKALKNAEKNVNKALEKADKKERSNAGFDAQKIKVLKKDHGARAGSNRAAKWDALVSSKTIGEARGKEDTLDAGSVAAAVKAGVISLS